MLSEQQIKHALRASRVMPMVVPNPHGPFGWEQLARTIARHLNSDSDEKKVVQVLELSAATWEKLQKLADEATRNTAHPVSASNLAAAILQEYVRGTHRHRRGPILRHHRNTNPR